MRTQVTFLHETNVPSNRLLSSVIIQWTVGSVGESAAGKQSTVLAWNPRRGRAARETAETFWHNTFTVSPGATVTAELEMTAQVRVWHLPLSVWHEENATKSVLFCFLLLSSSDVCVKSVGSARARRNSEIHRSQRVRLTSTIKEASVHGSSSWPLREVQAVGSAAAAAAAWLHTTILKTLKDELDPVMSSLFYLVSQTNYDVKVNRPQIVE